MSEEPSLLAYAAALKINSPEPIPAADWEAALTVFFQLLGRIFKEQTGVTIGHIKGFLNLENGGYGYFSTVGSSTGTTSRFSGNGDAAWGHLDFNVLVFGMSEEEVIPLVEVAVASLSGELAADCQLKKTVPPKTGGFTKKVE